MKLSKSKLKKAVRLIKSAPKIPGYVKEQYYKSPQRKTIESLVLNRALELETKPFFKSLNAVVKGSATAKDAKRLEKLRKRLLKGKGYTKQTVFELKHVFARVIDNVRLGEITEEDKKWVREELIPFVEWAVEQQRFRVAQERGLL